MHLAGKSSKRIVQRIDPASWDKPRAIRGIEDWTLRRDEWLATLPELEVMHEGQITRHVLGTQGTLPLSGNELC